jgi:hypothetical protein
LRQWDTLVASRVFGERANQAPEIELGVPILKSAVQR